MNSRYSPWPHLLRWSIELSALSAAVTITAGTATWLAERHAPGTNLARWPDSLWWAVVTICTVGYGEHFPVTTTGRLIAVALMMCGVAIIGTVAAMVALAFGHRYTERLEEAVRDAAYTPRQHPNDSHQLEDIAIPLPDEATAASLTWLLARLGWHPMADESGLGWVSAGLRVHFSIAPGIPQLAGVGRLTLAAGTMERMRRISLEALRHGFAPVAALTGVPENTEDNDAVQVLRTASGVEVALTCTPDRPWEASAPPSGHGDLTSPFAKDAHRDQPQASDGGAPTPT